MKITAIGTDHLLGLSPVLLRIIRRGYFEPNRELLAGFFSWHRGIQHPNLAGILDVGLTPQHDLYCIRNYYKACDNYADHQTFAGHLIAAVSALHAGNCVHGAIRPSNLFQEFGSLKLADPRITQLKSLDVTEDDIRFTAPEVLAGAPPSAASDRYSVGAVLYRIFCNSDPFDDFDLGNLKSKYMWASPRPLLMFNDLPKSIAGIVERLLEKDPQKRTPLSYLQGVFPTANKAIHAPFTGRTEETNKIRTFLQNRARGGLKIVLIEGEAGIGKTRFIQEWAAATKFQNIDSVIAYSKQHRNAAFGPLLEALRQLLRQRVLLRKSDVQEELGNFRQSLFPYFVPEGDPAADAVYPSERIVSDIAGLVRLITERKHLCLAIDDVDTADDWTVSVLEQLYLRAAEMPLTLILTMRPSYRDFKLKTLAQGYLHENALCLTLRPLDEGETRKLLSYLATSTGKDEETLKRSFGNPLRLEDCVQRGAHTETLSPRLEEVLDSVLAALTTPSRKLAQAVSVFFKPITATVVQILAGLSPTDFENSLAELGCVGLVAISGSTVSIKDERFRAQIYLRISKATRIRLHKSAYSLLEQTSGDEELLAMQAFHGRLFEDASRLSLKVANELKDKAKHAAAAEFYTRAQVSLRFTGRELDANSSCNLAHCYTYIGKHAQAEKTYRKLLSKPDELSADRALLASIYRALANSELRTPVADQLHFCRQAIVAAPPGWTNLVKLYVLLSQLLVQSGEIIKAQKALADAREQVTANTTAEVKGLIHVGQGYVWFQSGRFLEGAHALKLARMASRSALGVAYNNTALCWEHLGDLSKARKLQLRAQALAESNGHVGIEVMSLVNLGAFETKFGNFAEAETLFTRAATRLADLRSQDKGFEPSMLSVLQLDLARLEIELGRYPEAIENLKLAERAKLRGLERGDFLVARCELDICLGKTAALHKRLELLDGSELLRTEFFVAERILVESFVDEVTVDDKTKALERALEVSARLGTQYQYCKLLNRLSRLLLQAGHQTEAYKRAAAALEMAQKQGYRPLIAKIRLALALASTDRHEKESTLMEAFHSAIEIGMPELLAESAFHIAAEKYRVGQYIIAEEYLIKSISKTAELLQGIPHKLQAKYLAVAWRSQGPKLLQDCRNRMRSSTFSRTAPHLFSHDRYFRNLYRFALSPVGKHRIEDFITSLLATVEAAIQYPATLALQTNGTYAYHSVRMKVTEDVKTHVRSLNEKASATKIHLGSIGQKGVRGNALAWMPLRTQYYSGGLYLSSEHGESALNEQEIEFLTILARVANESLHQVEAGLAQLSNVTDLSGFHSMVGASKAIKEVYSQIEIAAGNAATVLIEGESGTGKELVAKAIHAAGPRTKEAFVAVDCGAIPEGLIEAELFGAKKGSYTGAIADRPGLFEAAHRGTLFLDEISNTTPALQAKLLRVIQEREVRRIGETKDRPIDVRLIVATNRNLEALANDGQFRKDLLYRLKVLHIKVPPLRSRRDDIPMLAHAFLQKLNTSNKAKKYFAPGIINHLSTQKFPGNVRELQNAVERAFFSAKGLMITELPLEAHVQQNAAPDDVQSWFKDLSEGRKDFWSAVHNRYKRRDISREKVIALVDYGLRSTRGSYKTMAAVFRLKETEYRRFMDFLRRNDCLLDFRPYRKPSPGVGAG